jgi:hypothetical protein
MQRLPPVQPSLLLLWSACLLLLASAELAQAQEGAPFGVRSASLQLVEGVYLLDARLYLPIDKRLREVLNDGVPVKLELQLEVRRGRGFWFDEDVASLAQQYSLQYHAVTDRYRVRNLNSGLETSFPTLTAAIEYLTHLTHLPVLDQTLVRKDRHYEVRMRAIVEAGSPPAALRWLMFWANDWRRVSEWYTWPLLQ